MAAIPHPACGVLHVTSFPGGGVDRHIRDIARHVPRRHLVWHVADAAEVIEIPAERRHYVLDPAATRERLAGWLRGQGVGIVHAHSVATGPRERAAWAAASLSLPLLATLHDVLFLRADGLVPGAPCEPEAKWLAQTADFLASAAARIAPSDYLAGLARRHLPGQPVQVIANGSAGRVNQVASREARAEFRERRASQVALVLGSIGPHKGARVIEEAAQRLAGSGSGIAIVIVGYLDAQVDPGWRGGNLFIHGAYDDEEVAALARAYGASLALFPNQAPESFSYALSDVWEAGLPALVPPEGALGERVRRHGGGWLLPSGFGAREVAAALREKLGSEAELARVKSQLMAPDADRVPDLSHMTRSLDALYERFGLPAGGDIDPASAPAQELLARNLDGGLFRQELARVADELAQLRAGLAQERAAAARFGAEAREWIAKLEADVAQVQSQLAEEVAQRRRLGEENAKLEVHKAALDLLPRVIRSHLLKRILNARG
ncbi:MAG TPA: glycosyltransferase family 4 protein [Usitatibacter sp.]|nr:glycosyltransferase family 4 protein [Usitatibacter sp.]